jgi:predicted enzyme related to lactoylglutathione lyase
MKQASIGISLLKIPVTDLSRSIPFYSALFGDKPEFASEPHGWAQFNLQTVTIALYTCGFGEDDRRPGGALDFHLLVNNLEALRSRLQQRCGLMSGGILYGANGSRSMDIADPDGNVMRLCERVAADERRLGTHVRIRRRKPSQSARASAIPLEGNL